MKLFDIVNSYTYVVKRQRIICTHVQKLPRAIGLASRESAKNRYQNIIATRAFVDPLPYMRVRRSKKYLSQLNRR